MTQADAEGTERLYFKVTGEFFTEHARDRMFDLGWEDALRFFRVGLPDLPLDNAVGVLSGHARLEGVNSFTLEHETAQAKAAHQKRLNWAYAGIVRLGRDYFRPYATVDNWGATDLPAADTKRRFGMSPYEGTWDRRGRAKVTTLRSVHYMDNKDTDLALVMDHAGDKVHVLWQKVPAPPFWLAVRGDQEWAKALAEYLAARQKLNARGHFQWYGAVSKSAEGRKVDAIVGPSEPQPIQTLPDPPKVIEEPVIPPESQELTHDMGWVTPDGKFYPCNYMGHIKLAHELWIAKYGRRVDNGEREAETAGWVKIAGSLITDEPYIVHDPDAKLTEAQEMTVLKWCDKHKVRVPWWFPKHDPDAT